MGEIIKTLGIDTSKILAQIIIFGIVYLILKKFAFGPVGGLLEERRRRIAEGEENLKQIKNNLASSEAKSAELLQAANADADRLLKEAKSAAAALTESERQRATSEASAIVVKAREASELERTRIMGELKRDFGRLVVDATSRVSGKVLNEEDQSRLNREALAQIANN